MIQRYTYRTTTWLDVVSPTTAEIRELIDTCAVPAEFAHDLTAPTPRTEVFAKKGALKITLDFPIVKRTDINHPHEIKFIVTKTHLITIRFEDIEAMHRFGKEFEVRAVLSSKSKTATKPPELFLVLLNYLYVSLHGKLDYLETRLKEVEEGIFDEREKEMVFELSVIGRRLIAFRQTIGAHENALEALPAAFTTAFTRKTPLDVNEPEHHYRSLKRHLEALTSLLSDLKETNHTLLTTKQNELMKVFTILAFITFPLTLFTSTFGMNTRTTPIIGMPGDFWIITGFMAIVSIGFFVYFKYKKWI